MKKIIKTILIIIQIMILVFIYNTNHCEATKVQEIDYTETIENFDNPERGFYNHFPYSFSVTDNKPINSKLSANLIHLRLDIGAFSKAVNGKEDLELSEEMLNTFDTMLKKIKSNGGTAIVRFAYDGFRGTANLEPSLDMILRHIEQLCPVFNENQDAIAYIELGFFGPYGEMHTSKISSTENVSKALDVMLDNTVDKIKIGVRTPNYYVKWLGIDRANIDENVTQEGTREYRVGLFNDGYLGSGSDLGTFANREKEITWLEKQAMHTLYGGEVVANYGKEPINTIEYISQEGFRTHTTYLNSEWNDKVIKAWKESIYNGEDEIYKGQSGYLYVANHLGYRFVLRNSELSENVEQEGKANIKLDIENVGFGNLVNEKIATIVLEKDDKKYEIKTELKPTEWNSREITKLNYTIELPRNIEVGEWKMYLRISQYGDMEQDNNYLCIRLANNNVWNEEIGANYIGSINIVEKQEEQEPTVKPNENINQPTYSDEDKNKPEDLDGEQNQPADSDEDKNKPADSDEEQDQPVDSDEDKNNSIDSDEEQNQPTKPDEQQKPSNDTDSKQENNKEQNIDGNKEKNEKDNNTKTDDTISDKEIPQTGQKLYIVESLIIIFACLSIFFYKKSRK